MVPLYSFNMKKNAWTLAEIVIALFILGIFAVIFICSVKTDDKKGKLFAYASLSNLSEANNNIIDKYGTLLFNNTDENDKYCLLLSDMLTTKSSINCNKNASTNEENIILPNNIVYMGLASQWHEKNNEYYKNILVDINGKSGENKAYKDRIPLKLYPNGRLIPVECTDEKDNEYCNGYTPSENLITYDIFNIEEDEYASSEDSTPISTNISYIKADCMVYNGQGQYSKKQCSEKSIEALKECAGDNDNPCIIILHKPDIGMNMFVETVSQSL